MSIEVGGDLPGEEPAARRRFCLSRTRRLGQRQRDYRKAWATACDEAGVPGRFRHDFRRTPVCNMERAGAPRSVAMKITGNKTATAITGTVR